jgi:hypothetical protein
VGPGRFELPTSRLSSARSNQLSYEPVPEGARARTAPLTDWSLALWVYMRIGKGCTGGGRLKPKRNRRWFPFRPCVSPNERHVAAHHSSLRKEVIQPQVPLRLPCYDFTPVADLTVDSCPLAVGALASGKTNSHGVTGGVYKARERIHRGMLIRDY